MKKFLLTLLILLGLGSLTACQLNFDPVYGEHEHEITGEFGYYEQIHWNICATCDEKVDKAWHNFGPWQRVSDDSLEERRTCLCGYYESRFHSHSLTGNVLYDDNEHYEECEKCFDHVNAVAHTYGEWTVGRESTEDVQGYELQVCSCGHTVYRSLPLKNHVHVWDGTYSITEDAHWKNCVKESCKMDEVDLLVPHNGGQATCTEDAVCVDCGYHYEEAFGHTEVTDSAVAPTCTESGLTEGSHCSVCNEVLVAQQTIDALGHDYESVVTNPTCTEKGYTTHTCKKGDHTYVDSYVDALGHDYESVVTNPTCTEKGYTTHTCKKGDHTYVDSYVDALDHTPKEAVQENVVPSTCTKTGSYDLVVYCSVCDAKLSSESKTSELAPHTEVTVPGKAASCTETGLTDGKKCSVCGETTLEQTEVPLEKHNYVDGICSICDGINPNHYFVVTIKEAKAAADGAKVSVSGTVSTINTAWSESYGNITVTITDTNGDTLNIYRMKTNVQLGDIITVKGVMATHDGSRQIGAGSTAEITGHDTSYDYKEMSISEALASDDNTNVILKGTVVNIKEAYSSKYNNISLYIADENGTQIYLYRLSGNFSVGQVIEVKGSMATYSGSRQVTGGTAEVLDEPIPTQLVLIYAKEQTNTLSHNILNENLSLPSSLSIFGKNYSTTWKVNGETVSEITYTNPTEETVVTAQVSIDINGDLQTYNVEFTLAASGAIVVVEKTAEISFADKANRTTFTTSQQVWEQNGITVTNNKASSTSNVADYANPARFYKTSKLIISFAQNITKIVVNCNSASYATALASSTVEGATIVASDKVCTITLSSPAKELTLTLTGGQVRVNSLTVTYQEIQQGETPEPTPEPQKLATPTVTISDEGLASWEAVANASGYTYKINDGAETTITTTSVQLTDKDSIVVKALGDGENYLDSDYSVSQQYDAPEVEEPDAGEEKSIKYSLSVPTSSTTAYKQSDLQKLFDSYNTEITPTIQSTANVYPGNSSSGLYQGNDCLKMGKSTAGGSIVFNFDQSIIITKVEVECLGWTNSKVESLTVNNIKLTTPDTKGTLTFNLDAGTSTLTFTSDARVYLFCYTIYYTINN